MWDVGLGLVACRILVLGSARYKLPTVQSKYIYMYTCFAAVFDTRALGYGHRARPVLVTETGVPPRGHPHGGPFLKLQQKNWGPRPL